MFESVLMRWTNLEPITHGEVNQKEKYNYCVLMHIYGIQNDGTDELIFRAAMEEQTENRPKDVVGEERRERVRCMETYNTICKIDRQWESAV